MSRWCTHPFSQSDGSDLPRDCHSIIFHFNGVPLLLSLLGLVAFLNREVPWGLGKPTAKSFGKVVERVTAASFCFRWCSIRAELLGIPKGELPGFLAKNWGPHLTVSSCCFFLLACRLGSDLVRPRPKLESDLRLLIPGRPGSTTPPRVWQ